MLLIFAGVQYWRWKLATRGAVAPAPSNNLTPGDLLRIVGFGLLAPLALYLLYLAIPAVSWRDHGVKVALLPFGLGIGVFTLWALVVPLAMATHSFRQRSIAAGLHIDAQPWHSWAGAVFTATWGILALILLLLPISWGLLALVLAYSPFSDIVQKVMMYLWAGLMLVLPLLPTIRVKRRYRLQAAWGDAPVIPSIPAVWVQKHPLNAPHHLAKARTMMTTYAIMTLFFAALVPVCAAFEQQYLRTDRVMTTMRQGDDISANIVEGQLTLMLRQSVRDGATTLGIPWK